jgi:hypothetical protein
VDLFVLTASTVDGVGVAGGGALVDNGIQTSERSARVAGHAPEGVGGARQQSCGGNGSGGPHNCGSCYRFRAIIVSTWVLRFRVQE